MAPYMSSTRRSFLGSMTAGTLYPRAAAGPVTCRIVDASTRRPLAARVRLVDSAGREVVPLGHSAALDEKAQEGDVRFQSRRFAYVDGSFTIDPASLPLRYQVIKGYGFAFTEGELSAAGLRDGAITIPLARWSSVDVRGWYSGDIHIHHISPKSCRLKMEAEDLDVANILTSDFTADQDQFEGKVNANSSRDRLIYVTQEFRNDHLGHLCLLNLKKLIEPVKPIQRVDYPLHLGVCDQARAQGAYVSWAHFPSWPGAESPLDVAMDKLDGLEILCVLDPRELSIFMKQLVPEMESNHGLRQWYRYLNCGYRLTATAGTDKMTTFVTVGANRVFAHVDRDFTYQSWIDALKAGRTFVTDSPLLSFTVNGREPGSTLTFKSPKDRVVQVHAVAESQLPYDRMEIVANGEPVAEATPSGPHHRAEIRLEYPVGRSCWLAARAYENTDKYRSQGVDFVKIHADQGTLVSNYYGTRRPEAVFAHSSPVYILRDNEPIRSWEDAQYYVRYLDNAIRWLETEAKFARPGDREASLEAFRRGRVVYEKRAAEARRR